VYAERIAWIACRLECYHSEVSIFSSVISENSKILHSNSVPYLIEIHNSKITHPIDPTKHKNIKNSFKELRVYHKNNRGKTRFKYPIYLQFLKIFFLVLLEINKKYLCLHLTEHHAIQIYGELDVRVHIFLNSAAFRSESDTLYILAVYSP